jgi:hypothetical protein
VALAAGIGGWLASDLAARDVLVVAGALIAVIGFVLSALFVRDTAAHVALEQARDHAGDDDSEPPLAEAFARTSYREPALRSCSQAGLVNNLNDGLAWGLVPLHLAQQGRQCLTSRPRRRALSRGVGHRSNRDGALVRPGRPKAAHRRRYGHSGARARHTGAQQR